MKTSVFGTGYVGLVQAVALADVGHTVVCVDIDSHKIAQLQRSIPPIHEPGLATLIEENQKAGRLHFTTQASDAVGHGQLIFIAVGTPSNEDGSADLGKSELRVHVVSNPEFLKEGTAVVEARSLAGLGEGLQNLLLDD